MFSRGAGYLRCLSIYIKVIKQKETEDQIIGRSSDGAALLFDAPSKKARDLKEGDVLLVKGMLARKV